MVNDPITQLYEWLQAKALDDVRNWTPPPRRYWASEAGGCLRRTYYRLSGARPAPESPDSVLIGMDGNVHHDIVRQLFDQAGVEQRAITLETDGSTTETYIRKEYHYKGYDIEVSGRPDGEIYTPYGWCVHEIKGKGMGFKYYRDAYKKGGSSAVLERMRIKDKTWEPQAQFMMDMRGLDKWCLTIKDRDLARMGVIPAGSIIPCCAYMDRDPKALDAALDRLVIVEKALESGEPPVHGHLPSSWQCKSCRWAYMCYEADERRERKLKPEVVYPVPEDVLRGTLEEVAE